MFSVSPGRGMVEHGCMGGVRKRRMWGGVGGEDGRTGKGSRLLCPVSEPRRKLLRLSFIQV